MPNKCIPLLLAILVFPIIFFISSCSHPSQKRGDKYSETRMLMGTIVRLDVCLDGRDIRNIDTAYQNVWERLVDISWRMNVFNKKSDVSRINNSNLQPVIVGSDTYDVLKKSVYFSDVTNGAFDVTVWPLIELWRNGEKNNRLPSPEQVSEIKMVVGSRNIQMLENNHVQLLNSLTKVDLGGIAKGYAIDEAAKIFRTYGINDFFIDAGGDIYVGGINCHREPWRIAIRDPSDTSQVIDVISLSNSAVTTSGNYERYFTINGQRWSHIIDPISGYPQKKVMSATVIAPSAMEADALATALTILGSKKGTDYIDSFNKSYASIIFVKEQSGEVKRYVSQEYEKFQSTLKDNQMVQIINL